MKTQLSEEAHDVGSVFHDALTAAGGVDLMRQSVLGQSRRDDALGLIQEMGIWDLDITEDRLQFEIAAELARVAGYHALPFPVVERFARSGDADLTALVASSGVRRVNHLDLEGEMRWDAVDLRGHRYEIEAAGKRVSSTMTPFLSETEVRPTGERDAALAAHSCLLHSWWLLGVLEHALSDTLQYTKERVQFGRPIVKFQAIAFQNADIIAEVEALREYAKFSLWTVSTAEPEARLTEALGLRVAAIRATDLVLRLSHQHYGAMGFTDEVDLSWLNRAAQSVRRLPEDLHRTRLLMLAHIGEHGWNHYGGE